MGIFIVQKIKNCDLRQTNQVTFCICPSDVKMQNSELHRKRRSSGMIKGMVNPFECIM